MVEGEDLVEEEDPIKEEDHTEEEKDLEEDPIEIEEGSAVGPMAEDEGWIEDPLEDLDNDSYISWEAKLQHIDDVPLEEDEREVPAKDPIGDSNGEGFIDWDAELQHLDDLLPKEKEMCQLDIDEDLAKAVLDEAEEEEIGKPEVINPIPVEVFQAEDEKDIIAEVVQLAQH